MEFQAETPLPVTLRLMRDGNEIARQEGRTLTVPVTAPGVYRMEASADAGRRTTRLDLYRCDTHYGKLIQDNWRSPGRILSLYTETGTTSQGRFLLTMISRFSFPTQIVFGVGAVQEVGPLVKKVGGTRALIVTDKGVAAAGLVAPVRNALEAVGGIGHL